MTTTPPRVSIGLPVYNGGRFIEKSIDSILGQTYGDFELVISDNASNDNTEEICRSYAARDKRIRYCRNDRNLGAAENYNRAYRLSTGHYFKWAAHDDILAPEFLERCVSVLDTCPSVVLCFPQTMRIDEDGRPIEHHAHHFDFKAATAHQRFEHWVRKGGGHLCNAVAGVIRSSVLRHTGLIGDYNSADVTLLGELLLWGKFEVLPETLFFRRDHPGRSMRANERVEEIAVWYNPANEGKVLLNTWRSFFEYLRAIERAATPVSEKLRCYRFLAEWFVVQRSRLKQELTAAARRKLKRQAT